MMNGANFCTKINFFLGISIDGPKEFHDFYRLDHSVAGTFEKVVHGIEKCKEYQVEFNTLTLLNAKNIEYPEKIFNFLIELGVKFMQFIPCVEIDPETQEIADFSITPEQYGEFLCKIFDLWSQITGRTKLVSAILTRFCRTVSQNIILFAHMIDYAGNIL